MRRAGCGFWAAAQPSCFTRESWVAAGLQAGPQVFTQEWRLSGKRLGPIGQRRWTAWNFRGAVLAWNPLELDWGTGELQLELEEKLILGQNQVRPLSVKSSAKGCCPRGHSQSPPPPRGLSFVSLPSPSQSVQAGLSEQQ